MDNWNIIAICDSTGSVGERYAYSAYGAPVFMTGAGVVQTSSPIGFETLYAGYRWDNPAPQMYYVRNRFLLPQVGTWNKRDPLGYVDGANLSTYSSHPIVVTDPSGFYGEPPWLIWLKNGGPAEKATADPSPASNEPLWLSQMGGPGKNCAACHPRMYPYRPPRFKEWISTSVYFPLLLRLREICEQCSGDPMIPQCADTNKCYRDAERIASAIAMTLQNNWSVFNIPPREGGYFCYAWAHAFMKSFTFSNHGDCFSADINVAAVPLPGGVLEDDVDMHAWLWIKTPCGETVYVDDGFDDGNFIHATPPKPGGYEGSNQKSCEDIRREHPGDPLPQPYSASGTKITE